MTRRRAAIVVGALVALLSTVTVAAARNIDREVGRGERVVLYGDSLAVEARTPFVEAMAYDTAAIVDVNAVPGIAPCDALDTMRADAERTDGGRPSVVVLEFAGNNATPCVSGRDGSPLRGAALAERYAADLEAAVELFAAHDVRVVIAGPPPVPGLPGGATELIDEAVLSLVTRWAGIDIGRVRYAPAGDTVTGPGGAYESQLPCLDGEGPAEGCEGGRITVRSPDRIHFCPAGQTEELQCPEYSSGARRFGEEMARSAAQALDPDY